MRVPSVFGGAGGVSMLFCKSKEWIYGISVREYLP